MKKVMIEQLVLGMVGTNTWLIKNKESNELLIIDPADESARIEEKIDRMGGIPVAVLLTHGHFDHMLAADDLRDEYGIPIIACAAEQQVLTDSIKNLSGSWASAHVLLADQWVCDGKKLELAGFSIEVFHTPGHTAGSCCYYLPEEEILFSGDTFRSVTFPSFKVASTVVLPGAWSLKWTFHSLGQAGNRSICAPFVCKSIS